MEGLTRLVAESLARHGFDRPLDYRRLHWSRWFRCESHHSLLSVPSKAGVFALAEEIMEFGSSSGGAGADTLIRPEQSERDTAEAHRMLAVTQFYEADDMAFMLDRMLSHQNPMRARLASGRYFFRFVVIEDAAQRRSICTALNMWMTSAAEKASGIGSHFASLEVAPHDVGQAPSHGITAKVPQSSSSTAPHLDSGAAANIHCPPFPSGF